MGFRSSLLNEKGPYNITLLYSIGNSNDELMTKQPKRKFGLAWLFSYQEEYKKASKAKVEEVTKKVVDIDERIRGTWMTLEAFKKERRIEATSRNFIRLLQYYLYDQKIQFCPLNAPHLLLLLNGSRNLNFNCIYFHVVRFMQSLEYMCFYTTYFYMYVRITPSTKFLFL